MIPIARLIRGLGNQAKWSELLKAATANESWSTGTALAAGLSTSAVALSYGPLVQQEAMTVAARLSWLALVPNNWSAMRKGQRIDAIVRVAKESLAVEHAEAAELAIALNQMLERLTASRGTLALSVRDRSELLERCKGRCTICGREFSVQEKVWFIDGRSPRASPSPRSIYDRWKPIYGMKNGWLIEVDHCAPISGIGDNDISNLQLSCRYCNNVKRERVSVFDAPRLLKPQVDSSTWKFHALRLIASMRCFQCNSSVHQKELTVGLMSRAVVPSLQNFFTTCYACDPQPDDRFLTAPPFEDSDNA